MIILIILGLHMTDGRLLKLSQKYGIVSFEYFQKLDALSLGEGTGASLKVEYYLILNNLTGSLKAEV